MWCPPNGLTSAKEGENDRGLIGVSAFFFSFLKRSVLNASRSSAITGLLSISFDQLFIIELKLFSFLPVCVLRRGDTLRAELMSREFSFTESLEEFYFIYFF